MNIVFWAVAALLYLVMTGAVLVGALRLAKTRMNKIATALAILAAFSMLPGIQVSRTLAQEQAEAAKKLEQQKYRQAAWAHFQKHCKEDAGERIFRIVVGVDAILLLNPRAQATDQDFQNQYWMGDPYGHDSMLPDSEIRNYLADLNEQDIRVTSRTSRPGYKIVETKAADGRIVRYQLDQTRRGLVATTHERPISKYGVVWNDISTDEDRKFWVAGGRLQVVELSTNATLGERIGYLIEPEFGARGGGRRPWLHARLMYSETAACPPFKSKSFPPVNRLFVTKVVKPGKGIKHADK